jgi:hypothetical protein
MIITASKTDSAGRGASATLVAALVVAEVIARFLSDHEKAPPWRGSTLGGSG